MCSDLGSVFCALHLTVGPLLETICINTTPIIIITMLEATSLAKSYKTMFFNVGIIQDSSARGNVSTNIGS